MIGLTRMDGTEVYVNPDHIVAVCPDDGANRGGSLVYLSQPKISPIRTKQTPIGIAISWRAELRFVHGAEA